MFKNRSDALKTGDTQYFTGKPCKYGHLSHRYTASGACAQCVSNASATAREAVGITPRARARVDAQRAEERAALLRQREERAEALQHIRVANIPVRPQHVDAMFELAIGLCLTHYPALTRADVLPNPQPVKGIPVYRVKVPHSQYEFIQETARALWDSERPQIDRTRINAYRDEQIAAMEKDGEAPEGLPWK